MERDKDRIEYFEIIFSKTNIFCKPISEAELSQKPLTCKILDIDKSDYEMYGAPTWYNHNIHIDFYRYGTPYEFKPDVYTFNGSVSMEKTKHDKYTVWQGTHMFMRYSFVVAGNNGRSPISIRLSVDGYDNPAIMYIHAIFCSIFYGNSYSDNYEREIQKYWNILHSEHKFFDTGSSPINLSNFNIGNFLNDINKIYDDSLLVIDDYPFMLDFINSKLKNLKELFEEEYKRLLLNTDDFVVNLD